MGSDSKKRLVWLNGAILGKCRHFWPFRHGAVTGFYKRQGPNPLTVVKWKLSERVQQGTAPGV